MKTQKLASDSPGEEKPKLQKVEPAQVKEWMSKDMKSAVDLVNFIRTTPELLDMVVTYATGLHNNRVDQENQTKP